MEIKVFHFNPFVENTYLLFDETLEAALIDCGCLTNEEKMVLKNFVDENNLTIKQLLNTHLHIDHSFGNAWAARTWGVLPKAHKADESLIEKAHFQAQLFGIYEPIETQKLGEYLDETEEICFGTTKLQVLHVPGHSAGSVCFYHAASHSLVSGDVLFRGSIGRTDLPGGDFNQLITHINEKLLVLPDETAVFCGHGLPTTIGQERATNPFL